ncbi:MAG: biopolymer transporter ExbD [Polyangiaceae bacterium]|nr:biopolymer transporter ExbD [Polyangiaceae bacterium]
MAGGASSDDEGMISGINVTPLVDVTLVLLIIMMVTAKVIVSQGVGMKLPQASQQNAEQLPLSFSVDVTSDGKTYVNKDLVKSADALLALATEAKQKDKDLRAIIRGDENVDHGSVMQVLSTLQKAKIAKIAFAVTPETKR